MNIQFALDLLKNINISLASVPTEVKEVETEIIIIPDNERFAALRPEPEEIDYVGFLNCIRESHRMRFGRSKSDKQRLSEQREALTHFVGYNPGLPFGTQLDKALFGAHQDLHRERGEIEILREETVISSFVAGLPDPLLDLSSQAARVRCLLQSVGDIMGAGDYGMLRRAVSDSYVLSERAEEVTGDRDSLRDDARLYASAEALILVQETNHLNDPRVTKKVFRTLNRWDIKVPGFNDKWLD
jgi:hypothetical protein